MLRVSWVTVFCAVLTVSTSTAQSIYGVSIDTTSLRGSSGQLIFDITSNFPLTNRADIINFSTDGTFGLAETQGTLVEGDLVMHASPAKLTRLKADGFLTELVLPFSAFGDQISFTLNVSETGPLAGIPPDQVSLYLLGKNEQRLDNAPNMSVTINGQRGGLLELPRQRPGADHAGDSEEADRAHPGRVPPTVPFAVVAASTPDDPALFRNAQTFIGTLTEYCKRRCAGEASCTGGAFGVQVDESTFYTFDDVSNLKAQVALVMDGANPLVEGQFGTAKVVGVLNNSVLTIQTISLTR
jgi:hypothetical protein